MKRFVFMTLILLVYVGIMCVLTLFYGSCSSDKRPKLEKDTHAVVSDTIVNISDKVEEQLAKSDTTIGKIETTIHQVQTLKKENEALKVELKSTKDSLVETKKLLKKRTFIQKVLGINKDTIQTPMRDTTN